MLEISTVAECSQEHISFIAEGPFPNICSKLCLYLTIIKYFGRAWMGVGLIVYVEVLSKYLIRLQQILFVIHKVHYKASFPGSSMYDN